MERLPVGITVHRVYEDGIVEDLICAPGHDLSHALDFIQKVTVKGHWVLIAPEQGCGIVAEFRAPIAPGLLSEIVSKAISAGQRARSSCPSPSTGRASCPSCGASPPLPPNEDSSSAQSKNSAAAGP
ncbi:hypothetical protein [Streptomyces mutabilis]|uniref:Uncharacterized protein n=1 Tax=Streptomyces mutabilis TaxID=67332 RepID=A0A086MR12_9ACTN|nr:hypothetical protein [Streptomyces mutabilis]KFG71330.1 hypothetical protein FM21_34035 [Streptomyces mutabilis]